MCHPIRLSLLLALAVSPLTLRAAEPIELTPGPASRGPWHVTLSLDAGGHSLVRKNTSEPGTPAADDQLQRLPISVAAKLAYDERLVAADARPDSAKHLVAIRYYDKAEAVIKVDQTGHTPKLSDQNRLIVLENSASARPLLFCPEKSLPRDELDLIDVVGNSGFVQKLLPGKRVAEGESWSHDAAVMGPLLALDNVAVCEVQSVLDSYTSSFAKLRMAGTVHGMADGAATEIEIKALYLYDRKSHLITRLNLAVKEKRSVGGATPGLDAIAKLQLAIDPAKDASRLDDDVLAKIAKSRPAPTEHLSYEALELGFRVCHDRWWFVTSEARESMTLGRIDQGDLVAQCTLTTLPSKSAGRQTTLEKFKKDVIFALGKSFGELVSSRQWQNEAGHYCYELVARGLVQEVPVEWHYYLVAPEAGHRVSVAVTIEKSMVERLAGADRELVNKLELRPILPAAETAAKSPSTTQK